MLAAGVLFPAAVVKDMDREDEKLLSVLTGRHA